MFPAISTGAYRRPVEGAARIAVRTVREAETSVEKARFDLFDESACEAFAARVGD